MNIYPLLDAAEDVVSGWLAGCDDTKREEVENLLKQGWHLQLLISPTYVARVRLMLLQPDGSGGFMVDAFVEPTGAVN